jgi:hypothetical protein
MEQLLKFETLLRLRLTDTFRAAASPCCFSLHNRMCQSCDLAITDREVDSNNKGIFNKRPTRLLAAKAQSYSQSALPGIIQLSGNHGGSYRGYDWRSA